MKIPKKLKIGEGYEIKWLDTFSYTGWWTDEDIKKKGKEMDYFQSTIGYYVGEFNGFIVLAMSENPHEDFARWGSPKWIPKGCIKSIKKYIIKKPKKKKYENKNK